MKEFTFLGWKNQGVKTLNDGPVSFTFNLSAIDVQYGMWMDECANCPRCIMVGFDSLSRLQKMKKELFDDYDDVEFPIGEYEKIGENYYRIFFNFQTKERWKQWYDEKFCSGMRKIAVEWFKEEGYMPPNYAQYFVMAGKGDIIHIPENSGYNHYTLSDSIPKYENQALTAKVVMDSSNMLVVQFDELSIPYNQYACYPRCAQISAKDLFDFNRFLKDYIE